MAIFLSHYVLKNDKPINILIFSNSSKKKRSSAKVMKKTCHTGLLIRTKNEVRKQESYLLHILCYYHTHFDYNDTITDKNVHMREKDMVFCSEDQYSRLHILNVEIH